MTTHKTGCVLCAQNCGLEIDVEGNRITGVRPDRTNPRSEGYACRKGLNVAHHQHHRQRLSYPLKRTGRGFERIPWDQAFREIAIRLKEIIAKHGPRALAYMGGGGQGCHFEAAFGVRLLRALGSQYHYNALGQELTGHFWVQGRFTGRQYLFTMPDHHKTDMLLAVGWNGMMSHQMPQARRYLTRFAKDPEKILVVIDPRRSETARIADIHLAIRPGTDALLFKAMTAIILQNGWENREYLSSHANGFYEAVELFSGFDARSAVEVCQLDYEKVREVARLFATRRSSMHADLGTLMGRRSTLTSYLQMILLAVCGRICVPGGNIIPGHLMPLGSHSDERDPRTWRTVSTGYPAIMGVFPPNVMPEEIMSENPERLRAVLCFQSNPLRSYADTRAYEEAFKRLDLLVTAELAMTETAALSHYVLPARSGYESWDGTFFAWTYPEIFFQMRRPILEPEGERLELGQMHVGIADALGLIPPVPRSLMEASRGDRLAFGMELMRYVSENPKVSPMLPFVLAKTLGEAMGSAHLAALWGLLQGAPTQFRENAERAGFKPGPAMGEEIFKAILDHPEGIWVGRMDERDNFSSLQHPQKRLEIFIPELAEEVRDLEPKRELMALTPDPRYPYVLMAGRHMDFNANTLMRDPSWNEGKRACTCAMHPEDAASLGLADGAMVRVVTEASSVEIELEVDKAARRGHVTIPHGFGLSYEGRTHGVNVNLLTSAANRDPIAGTPIHRYVPCRVEPL
jgi:anaerobic selenocysteine-containing dehydrogenase